MSKRIFNPLKIVGAILLLAAFFLPLSRCEITSAVDPNVPEEEVVYEKTYDYFYAWEGLQDGELLAKTLIPLAFVWPLIFLGLRWRIKNTKVNKGLLFLEPLIAVGGSYFVFMINFLNELYIGFYVAMFGGFLFFLGSLLEIGTLFRKEKLK